MRGFSQFLTRKNKRPQQLTAAAQAMLQIAPSEQTPLHIFKHTVTLEQAGLQYQQTVTQLYTELASASSDSYDPDQIYRSNADTPAASQPSQPILKTKANNFRELLNLANSAPRYSVIDLCGRHYRYLGEGSTTITNSDITLRNGTIHLALIPKNVGPSLQVRGSGVRMEGLTICGGSVGVWVNPGADVTLTNCLIQRAFIGVWVGRNPTVAGQLQKASHLMAEGLKVSECSRGSCVGIGNSGTAILRDCELSGGKGCGITVCGDSPGRLDATGVRCFGNAGGGVMVKAGSQVSMTNCSIRDNQGGSVWVRGKGSKLLLQNCEMDVKGVASEKGKLQSKACTWVKCA